MNYMNCNLKRVLIVFSTFVILISLCGKVTSAKSQDDPDLMIQIAEQSLSSAFENVLESERVGSNVSVLIFRLDEAAELLEKAKSSLLKGELNNVDVLTQYSVEIASEVEDEAIRLKGLMVAHQASIFNVSLVLSVVGVPGFLFLMFRLWRWFKKYYTKRILSLRPEVTEIGDT